MMADTAVYIKGGGEQEILIVRGLNFLMNMLFFLLYIAIGKTIFILIILVLKLLSVHSHYSQIFK